MGVRFDDQARDAVDDAGRVFQSLEKRVMRKSFVFEPKIGVLHRSLDLTTPTNAQKVGETKVLSADAPFIVKAGFVGGDEAAALFHEAAELVALRIAERGDVRQDQCLEPADQRGIEQAIVDHFELDAGFNERLIPPEGMILDFGLGATAAVKPGGLLRINECHARARRLVAQVVLSFFVPGENVLDHFEPAGIVEHAAEFAEPRTQAIGDAVQCPDANFRGALDAVLPTVRFFQPDAEQADNRLAPHGGAIFLAVFAIGPRKSDTAAGLAIGHQHRRQFADLPHVKRTKRAAAGIRDDAGIRIDLADLGVPQAPERPAAVADARGYRRGAAGSCGFGVRGRSNPVAALKLLAQCSQKHWPEPSQRLMKIPLT